MHKNLFGNGVDPPFPNIKNQTFLIYPNVSFLLLIQQTAQPVLSLWGDKL